MGTYFDPKDIKTKEELVKLGLLTDLSIIQDDSIEFADCKPYVADVTVSSQIVWPEADGAEDEDNTEGGEIEEGGANVEHQGGEENITPTTPVETPENPETPSEDENVSEDDTDNNDTNDITFTFDDVEYTYAGDPNKTAKSVFKALTKKDSAMLNGDAYDFAGKKAFDLNGLVLRNSDN